MPGEAAIREEVSAWLRAHWSPERSLRAWRELLLEANWAAPAWPVDCFGRGYTQQEAAVVRRVFETQGAVGAASAGPRTLAAETILAHGNAAQKQRFLPPILLGDEAWCQLFSEPGSGSDLAGLSTRAERASDAAHGDHWLINGQKVWNTSAHHADFGILLARTDWDLPKHQGISYFLIDMRQPGVEVRPLRQMNGHASFNEVFLTDAIVPAAHMLGAPGDGWRIAMTTLSIERSAFGRDRSGSVYDGFEGPIYEAYREELAIANAPYSWYPQRAGRPDLLMQRALATGAIDDAATRQEIARALILAKGAQLASAEAKRRSGSNEVVPAGSIGKLAASAIARQCAAAHTLIAGSGALLAGPEADEDGLVAEILLSVPAISIAGGTDEIQRNIVSERVLGMTREPRFDRGPFRDIPRNAAKDA